MTRFRVLFATDSELGNFGLGGPALHLAKELLARVPPSHVVARADGGSGVAREHLTLIGTPWWIRLLGSHRRLSWMLPDQAWDRTRFDRWMARQAVASAVWMVENATSRETIRRAKSAGSKCVLMYYNRSFRSFLSDVEDERARWGGPRTFLDEDMVAMTEDECGLADRIVVMSDLVHDDLVASGVTAGKIRRARYGVDATRFRPTLSKKGPFVVALVGWLELRKGYPYLVEAFRDAAIPGSRLLLHGGTSIQFHHGLVERLRGNSDVRVVRGPVEETYAQASVVVLPSVSDAYGLVALEAMACGIPVVVTDRCGAAEDVQDGVNGFVVPARDSAAIRDRLLQIHADPELGTALGHEGRLLAERRPWLRFCDEVLSVVTELEAEATGSPSLRQGR